MLPTVTSQDDFNKLNIRQDVFFEAARTVLVTLGLATEASSHLSFPANGSLPVVLIGDMAALKFFPALFSDAVENEVSALLFLAAQPGLVPRLIDTGPFEGWHYVLMSRLPGQSLKTQWDDLSATQRQEACR